MTTTEDTETAAPAVRRQPLALCLAVGAAVPVGWVLYRHYWADDVYARFLRWGWFSDHFWASTLLAALILCVPYAVVLLVWGRSLTRSLAGAAVALGCGLFLWGWDRVFSTYLWDSRPPGTTSLRVYLWGGLLVLATLVPLAWGLARRTGRAWMLGLVVAPVVAAVLRELELRWSWWHDRVASAALHQHWQLQAVVYVAPFIAAVLAGWAIEARDRRTADQGSAGSAEMGSSA